MMFITNVWFYTISALKHKVNNKHNVTADETEDDGNPEEKAKKTELNKIYLKLKNLWNQRELSIINNLIIELKNKIDNGD